MERTAQCHCGALRIVVSGEPTLVAVCHCVDCQRRTGSAFGSNAYFEKSNTRIEGPSKVFIREGQEGRKVRFRFCPDCGTSLYWEADLFPNHYGIAVGGFADPRFEAPSLSAWERSIHHWVSLPRGIQHYQQARPQPRQNRTAE
jgi:hypothetical protein